MISLLPVSLMGLLPDTRSLPGPGRDAKPLAVRLPAFYSAAERRRAHAPPAVLSKRALVARHKEREQRRSTSTRRVTEGRREIHDPDLRKRVGFQRPHRRDTEG